MAVSVVLTALATLGAQAHDAMPASRGGPAATASADVAKALRLEANPLPLAARFSVMISQPPAVHNRTPRRVEWTFIRDAQQIALLKGAIDEAWHRDEQGRVRFERVFHDDQQAVDYSTGELTTLDVRVDWAALSTFIDSRELLSLKLVSIRGRGADERVHLRGAAGGETLTVEWMPALQLPARITRTGKDGAVTRIELRQHFLVAPASWPIPGVRSASYLRFDAADFGDMDYETVVKKSEALDIRLGWRTAHKHD
jgi:hypothetical protein